MSMKLFKKLACVWLLAVCGLNTASAENHSPDFAAIDDVSARKETFMDYFNTLAIQLGDDIQSERLKIQSLQQKQIQYHDIADADKAWLQSLAKRYGLQHFDFESETDWTNLLKRVDIVPTSLVIAQAANESAWGTSRFVQLGNNYFGQWCFSAGCGIVPASRAPGKTHEVQSFASPYQSLKSYVHNINTNQAYASLREIRESSREQGMVLSGHNLAQGLLRYSELGEEYVNAIRKLIAYNQLERFD